MAENFDPQEKQFVGHLLSVVAKELNQVRDSFDRQRLAELSHQATDKAIRTIVGADAQMAVLDPPPKQKAGPSDPRGRLMESLRAGVARLMQESQPELTPEQAEEAAYWALRGYIEKWNPSRR